MIYVVLLAIVLFSVMVYLMSKDQKTLVKPRYKFVKVGVYQSLD